VPDARGEEAGDDARVAGSTFSMLLRQAGNGAVSNS
jgi:hypothetical protein